MQFERELESINSCMFIQECSSGQEMCALDSSEAMQQSQWRSHLLQGPLLLKEGLKVDLKTFQLKPFARFHGTIAFSMQGLIPSRVPLS